jgi:hypothetical protein
MIFTSFKLLQPFFWKKNTAQDFSHRNLFDLGRLTKGPRSHVGWPAWPGRLARAQADRLPGTAGGRPWRRLRRGKRRRKEGSRTGSSPGTRRWGRLGRRMDGGDEFGGGGGRCPARNP